MDSRFFAPQSAQYMIDHMNADHADANRMYAKVYGQLWGVTAARMLALDREGMELEVTVPDGSTRLRIPFDHRLQDEADAQRTLVAMARQAHEVMTQGAPPDASTP